MFDNWIQKLSEKHFELRDILLEWDNRIFQLDTVLLLNNTLYLFEVKNFIGEFIFRNDKFYNEKGIEKENPLTQLSRSTSLLRQIFEAHRFNIPIKSYIVFVNPNCTIYLPNRIDGIILPTQINRFISNLPVNQNLDPICNKIVQTLLSLHLEKNLYQRLPDYYYEELKKGLICIKCGTLSTTIEGYYCNCKVCNHREPLENAILKSIKELQFAFPASPLTTNLVQDWCCDPSRKRILRILKKHYTLKGGKKTAYFK